MVEGARLERVYRGNSIEGSNPSLSATTIIFPLYNSTMFKYLSYPTWGLDIFCSGFVFPPILSIAALARIRREASLV